jgi:hypothetical protein
MSCENVQGKVSRLYVNAPACNIRLDTYGDRYFILNLPHQNYHSIYSLLVAAAVNRYTVLLRLEDYEPPDPPSNIVQYIVLDW